MNIYISSIAFAGATPEEMMESATQNQWAVEFSSGMPYRQDLEEFYLKAPLVKMPHNYFPPPAIPFVLNLASGNDQIRQQSIDHCINGIKLATSANAPFFAAHAGFCIDPDPAELGKKIIYNSNFNKEKHWKLFLDSLTRLNEHAEATGIDFLVENNVIAAFNLTEDGSNPLFCCESTEITRLFSELTFKRLGLLLDTAHLKVSCQTLGLDLHKELHAITPFIKGIHHSDNDGTVDGNSILTEGYWFLEHLPAYKNLPHVLEVKKISPTVINEQINLLKSYGR